MSQIKENDIAYIYMSLFGKDEVVSSINRELWASKDKE